MPLVRNDQPEVAALTATKAVVSVQDELDVVNGVPVIDTGIIEIIIDLDLAAASHRPDELDDRVIEVDSDVSLGRRGHRHSEALHRIHELLKT